MTIRRGEAWGEHRALPDDGVVVRSDAEARHVVERARRAGEAVPTLGLLGGDLCRTLGGTGDADRLRTADALAVAVDVGAVLIDGRLHWFVAHMVARHGWLRGPIHAAMNAQFLGSWDVAPRSHPNDGVLDTLVVTMGMGERLKARRRVRTGTHVPHPGIEERRPAAVQWDLGGAGVWLDGERVGRAKSVSVRIEPDAITCVV
ncbi:MAG: hypothetical protein ACR2LQ_10260 [Acidimicrobiales bacterium]